MEKSEEIHPVMIYLNKVQKRSASILARNIGLPESVFIARCIPLLPDEIINRELIYEPDDIKYANDWDKVKLKNFDIENIKKLFQELAKYKKAESLINSIKEDLENFEGMIYFKTYEKLLKWCNPARKGNEEKEIMTIAHKISEELFGYIINEDYSDLLPKHYILQNYDKNSLNDLLNKLFSYDDLWVKRLVENIQKDLALSQNEWIYDRTYKQISRWCNPQRDSPREQFVKPIIHEISKLLFNEVIIRVEKEEIMLTEAFMETLVKNYPDYFIEKGLTLISQQENFPAGRTDLIFKDKHGTILIVELKKGTLTREHVGQIADYYLDVKKRYAGQIIELMVMANNIPPNRKEFLEEQGVSFKEIPESKFINFAKEHNIDLPFNETTKNIMNKVMMPDEIEVSNKNPDIELINKNIQELIDYKESWVRSNYTFLSHNTYAQLSRWCNPHRYSSREQFVKPRVHAISNELFGKVISRVE